MKLSVIIPTLNEEKTIASVIRQIKGEVFVIDANSTDKTVEIARKYDAKIIKQKSIGKGNALKQAFKQISSDIYVIIDGDNTYNPKEINKLIKPVILGEADLAVGSRILGNGRRNIRFLNLFGNFLFNLILRLCLKTEITDMLSGFRAINKELINNIKLISDDFEIETEMTVKTIKNGYKIKEVPVSYRKRITPSKLHPIKDGIKIFFNLIKFIFLY
jgi:dolichol-phosphate mannosyltransferase